MNTANPASGDAIHTAEAGGILTIDLGALASNWKLLRDRSQNAECAAVVKANAYGIGIEQAVPVLASAGCKTFFVALLSEALRVRKIAPEATIYVLNGLFPETSPVYMEHRLRPVLGSLGEIREWAAFNKSVGTKAPAAIHIDTGMARLGLSRQETSAVIEGKLNQAFDLGLLMSHFVTSEEAGHPTNQKQIEAFLSVKKLFPEIPASLANSSGIFLKQMPHFDLVRPGYALYGGNPLPGKENPMKPVVRLEGRIVQIREIPHGTGVGYNNRWTAEGMRRLATISVGYSDGYPRSASATDSKRLAGQTTGNALVAGQLCPFAGTVSMDLIIIDISAVSPDKVAAGDLVTLIGDELSIDRVGECAGTIGYEILTNLGRRYARRYTGGAA